MSTKRFDQEPSIDYGKCTNCELVLPTAQDAHTHMHETMKANLNAEGLGSGHRVHITNQTREDRIKSEIDHIVRQAIDDALGKVEDLIADEDITEEEAATALNRHPDFADAWQDFE